MTTVVRLAGRAQRQGSRATNVGCVKRWLLLFGGILLVLAGLAVSALGVGVLTLFNANDSVSTPVATAKAPGAALLIENIRIDASSIPLPHSLGTLQLSASSPSGRSLFLGAAPADGVDTYLTGAPYDVVVDLTSGGKVTTRPVPGTQTPAPPDSQHFWTQQSNGRNPSISALVGNDATVVLMNSDASTGVTADLVVSLRLPGVRKAGWTAVGLGILSIVLGALALWRSHVAKRASQAATGAHVAPAPVDHQSEPVREPDADVEPDLSEVQPAEVVSALEEPAQEADDAPAHAAAQAAVEAEVADPTLIPPWVFVEGSDAVITKPLDDTGTSTESA